jgi:transposase
VNAGLREVIARQETVIAAQDARLAMQDEQIATQGRLIDAQAAQLATQMQLIEGLQAEVAELRRRLGMDSTNSSSPPSKDGPATTRRQGQRGSSRAPGGQKGRQGKGLDRVAVPDRVEVIEPGGCGGCGASLVGAAGEVAATAQVFDIAPVVLEVTEYRMMRRVCRCCAAVTTADAPAGVFGPACYGPNVTAATTLLAAEGHMSITRAAAMMAALLGASVSTGFTARCLARLGQRLHGFEAALKDRLRDADVLATDETPANVAQRGNHHIYTVRTENLVWYGAADNRGHAAIDGFGILPGFTGVLVRDDYGGYHKYDPDLAGVQLCCAHLLRDLKAVHEIDPDTQVWAEQVGWALRQAATLAEATVAAGADRIDTDALAHLRWVYDQGVAVGISVNLSRRWHQGNHPGLVLARRLRKKADQVWLFTSDLRVPWTNNHSEQALRMVKLQQKISGCWRTLATTQLFCRIRSYLTTARNHGIRPLDAIRDALTGTPWMPPVPA